MTRYRLRAVVSEGDSETLWVGVLPGGPILRVEGIGVLVLDLISSDPDRGWTAGDLVSCLRAELTGMPEDAETALEDFFAGLESWGIVETVAGERA